MEDEVLVKAIKLVENWLKHAQGMTVHATKVSGEDVTFYATEEDVLDDTLVGRVIRFYAQEGDMPEELTDHAAMRKDFEAKHDEMIKYLDDDCPMAYDIVYLRILDKGRYILKLMRNAINPA